MLRDITESNCRYDAISTVRMLTITNCTSPGYCRLSTAFIFLSLKFLYKLYSLINLSDGLCIAKMFSVIQFEFRPSIALGNFELDL